MTINTDHPKNHKLFNKKPSTRHEKPGESRDSSNNVVIATALGFFQEFEGKTLLLKIPHILDTEPGGFELGLT